MNKYFVYMPVNDYVYIDYTTLILSIITIIGILLLYKYSGNTNFIHLINNQEELKKTVQEIKKDQKTISKEIHKNTNLSVQILEKVSSLK